MPSSTKRRLVLGVTGPIGAGVTTVSNVLESRGFHRFSISSTIKTSLAIASPPNIKPSREELQEHGNDMRRLHGEGYWLSTALKDAKDDTDIVIDSIRNSGEIEWLRNEYPWSYIIAVYADASIRMGRVIHGPEYSGNLNKYNNDNTRDWDLEEQM